MAMCLIEIAVRGSQKMVLYFLPPEMHALELDVAFRVDVERY
jgi:hypothetical protein